MLYFIQHVHIELILNIILQILNDKIYFNLTAISVNQFRRKLYILYITAYNLHLILKKN